MKNKPPINNLKAYKDFRQELRNNRTDAEYLLWFHLQNKKLNNYKFRRQHSVTHYILDFYCPEKKLAVELDGAHHYTEEGLAHDEKRDNILKELEITTIRFENKLVRENIEFVLREIAEQLENL